MALGKAEGLDVGEDKGVDVHVFGADGAGNSGSDGCLLASDAVGLAALLVGEGKHIGLREDYKVVPVETGTLDSLAEFSQHEERAIGHAEVGYGHTRVGDVVETFFDKALGECAVDGSAVDRIHVVCGDGAGIHAAGFLVVERAIHEVAAHQAGFGVFINALLGATLIHITKN